MGYDYTGYGVCSSNGGPSVTATCSDVAAVLTALETIHGIKRRDVILYGQSVGSGPTVSATGGCVDKVVVDKQSAPWAAAGAAAAAAEAVPYGQSVGCGPIVSARQLLE
jgi:hypothetical protein